VKRIAALLAEFSAIAAEPKKQLEKYLSAGKKVVGCMPYFCPEELIAASGMVPFGLWGAEMPAVNAKSYFPSFTCSILQTILELGIRGDFDRLSAVMIPLLCDSLKSMHPNWRYGVKKKIPVIPVTHAQNRKIRAGVDFTVSQYRAVRKQLEELSGNAVTDDAIVAAVREYNRHRAVMRRFIAAAGRHPELVSPPARSAVFKSSYFTEAGEHYDLVLELTELLENAPAVPWKGPKIVTSGILADSPVLLEIFADCGIAIVDDQVTHESLHFRVDVPETGDPLVGMAERIGRIEGCPVLFDPGKQRGIMLRELVNTAGADGVIFVQTKFCDPDEYDYVPLKQMLDEAGIPSLRLEVDRQGYNYEQVRTAVETFCSLLS